MILKVGFISIIDWQYYVCSPSLCQLMSFYQWKVQFIFPSWILTYCPCSFYFWQLRNPKDLSFVGYTYRNFKTIKGLSKSFSKLLLLFLFIVFCLCFNDPRNIIYYISYFLDRFLFLSNILLQESKIRYGNIVQNSEHSIKTSHLDFVELEADIENHISYPIVNFRY